MSKKELTGLSRDLSQVFKDNSEDKHKDIDEYAEKLSECFTKFLIHQEFRIVESEIDVKVSNIKTTAPTAGNIPSETLMRPFRVVFESLKKMIQWTLRNQYWLEV